MRKLIYFPNRQSDGRNRQIASARETGRLGPASAFHHLAKYLNKSDKNTFAYFATLLTFGHPRK